MYTFTANTKIESAKVNQNFLDLASGVGDDDNNKLELFRSKAFQNFIVPGTGIWSGDSYGVNRNASMSAIEAYINGKYVTASAVTARTFTASKDTYVYMDENGAFTYTEKTNGGTAGALPADSVLVAIVVTGASSIASASSIYQYKNGDSSLAYNTDNIGNPLYPHTPFFDLQYTSNENSVTHSSGTLPEATWTIIVPEGGAWLDVSCFGENKLNAAPAIGFSLHFKLDGNTWHTRYTDNYNSSSDTQLVGSRSKIWVDEGSHTVRIDYAMNGNATTSHIETSMRLWR